MSGQYDAQFGLFVIGVLMMLPGAICLSAAETRKGKFGSLALVIFAGIFMLPGVFSLWSKAILG